MSKPRFRVLANGWVRHDGRGMPSVLRPEDRVRARSVGGSMEFMDGLPADCFAGWEHAGWSRDILYWSPHRDSGSRAERQDPEEGLGPKDGRAASEGGIAQPQVLPYKTIYRDVV